VTRVLRALGLVLFMSSLALLGWWWLGPAAHPGGSGGWRAITRDAALFSAFALHHSALARPRAKHIVERLVPGELVRTAYVWVASLLLAAMCLLWQPVGGVAYRAAGPVAWLLGAAQVLGAAIVLLAVRRISLRELAGVSEPRPTDRLQHGGPYRLVRHPLYLGWVLMVFGTGHMTGDRLLFATLSLGYLLVAMPLEEAGLVRQFGNAYLEYQQRVRWRLIPYVH